MEARKTVHGQSACSYKATYAEVVRSTGTGRALMHSFKGKLHLNDDNINNQALSEAAEADPAVSPKLCRRFVIPPISKHFGFPDLASCTEGRHTYICIRNRLDVGDGGRYEAAGAGKRTRCVARAAKSEKEICGAKDGGSTSQTTSRRFRRCGGGERCASTR
jgi:hypothetical protein